MEENIHINKYLSNGKTKRNTIISAMKKRGKYELSNEMGPYLDGDKLRLRKLDLTISHNVRSGQVRSGTVKYGPHEPGYPCCGLVFCLPKIERQRERQRERQKKTKIETQRDKERQRERKKETKRETKREKKERQ